MFPANYRARSKNNVVLFNKLLRFFSLASHLSNIVLILSFNLRLGSNRFNVQSNSCRKNHATQMDYDRLV